MYRKQFAKIKQDLAKKMVFIVGPRQVGKTWLAKELGKEYENTLYLNYDRSEDREIIKQEQWPKKTELLIFDELHKMPGWKNYLKGIYDTKESGQKIIVTGSARMDIFRQSGDSMVGRFFLHHLMPLSLAEIKKTEYKGQIDRLIEKGGFPEPFLAHAPEDADRWRTQYFDGLVRNDILDFEAIHDLHAMQMILELLRRKVGSPISYSSIAEDVQISPATVSKYISILESLYIVFRVTPFSRNIARSLLKEPKIYFFDNGLVVGDEGVKLENFVAISLLKSAFGRLDYVGKKQELKFLRTKEGKEVDFALVEDGQVLELIEVKLAESDLSATLKYFSQKYNLPGRQVVKELKREKRIGNIDIVLAEKYLGSLEL